MVEPNAARQHTHKTHMHPTILPSMYGNPNICTVICNVALWAIMEIRNNLNLFMCRSVSIIVYPAVKCGTIEASELTLCVLPKANLSFQFTL